MVPTSRLERSKITLPDDARYYGVDGCKAGWILAAYCQGQLYFSLYKDISAVITSIRIPSVSDDSQFPSLVLIDIPIGLPETGERACDREGRELLGSRRSTLFPVPVRSAVYARTFQECGERNVIGQGRRVSIQFWNIAKKVIEVDQFLQRSPDLVGRVCEAHPELAFSRLSGSVLTQSKHSAEGRTSRLEVIERCVGRSVRPIIDQFMQSNKKYCSEVDLLDAASLALLSSIHAHTPKFVGDGLSDGVMIPMKILC